MPDPGYVVHCPTCRSKLTYEQTLGSDHVYRCEQHGAILLRSDGRVEVLSGHDKQRVAVH